MENIENKDIDIEVLENESTEITTEPVEIKQKLSNTELNNNIVLDLIVKTSKLQQMLNVIMDYNNTETLNSVISHDNFKEMQELLTNLFIILKGIINEFAQDFENIRKDK